MCWDVRHDAEWKWCSILLAYLLLFILYYVYLLIDLEESCIFFQVYLTFNQSYFEVIKGAFIIVNFGVVQPCPGSYPYPFANYLSDLINHSQVKVAFKKISFLQINVSHLNERVKCYDFRWKSDTKRISENLKNELNSDVISGRILGHALSVSTVCGCVV